MRVLQSLAGKGCWRPALAMAALVCSGCNEDSSRLTQEAYVWQFNWRPEVLEAVAASSAMLDGWHVLAGIVDRRGSFRPIEAELDRLGETGRPITLVIRIDAAFDMRNSAALVEAIRQSGARWPKLQVGSVEIDYDSATSRLRHYQKFLELLKAAVPSRTIITTMLPTWMDSKDFPSFAATPDGLVLQVHAIQEPKNGLFDPAAARMWIDRLAARTDTPFRVALPTYGSRVNWGSDGSVVSVESESEVVGGGEVAEVHASPFTVSQFVRSVRQRHPARMRGIVWFRLPLQSDQRAWKRETWWRVMAGDVSAPEFAQAFRAVPGQDGLFDVVLSNHGGNEDATPALVRLDASCTQSGGANGYTAQGRPGDLRLVGSPTRLLSPDVARTIGWARCRVTPARRWLPNQG